MTAKSSDEPAKPPTINLKTYRALKRKIINYETENCNTIAVLPCSGHKNWYEIADHSALLYCYKICEKIQKNVVFRADIDSIYDKYHLGFIRTKGVDLVRDRIREAGLYQTEQCQDYIYYFKLSTHFDEKVLARLEETENQRRIQNLTLVSTNNLDPQLHHLLTSVATRFHRICITRLDKPHVKLTGFPIIRLADSLLEHYHTLTLQPSIESAESRRILTKMRQDIYLLIIKVQMLSETHLWDSALVVSASEPLIQIRDLINSKLKALQSGAQGKA